MDLAHLDGAVQFFCSKRIAASSHRTYQSALRRFSHFCVSEAILCYFASYLASQNLAPQTIKTYLAGIRHMQITLGLPEPKEFSSLPRLQLVQAGIKRVHATKPAEGTRIRLPITPAILKSIHQHWNTRSSDPDIQMLWAAAVSVFSEPGNCPSHLSPHLSRSSI